MQLVKVKAKAKAKAKAKVKGEGEGEGECGTLDEVAHDFVSATSGSVLFEASGVGANATYDSSYTLSYSGNDLNAKHMLSSVDTYALNSSSLAVEVGLTPSAGRGFVRLFSDQDTHSIVFKNGIATATSAGTNVGAVPINIERRMFLRASLFTQP